MATHPSARVRAGTTAVLGVIALMGVACVDAAGLPTDCSEPSVERAVTVTADAMEPRGIDVCHGQEVDLTVDPEVDGVFHVHGFDDALPATTMTAGEELPLAFEASRSGQFVIELHPAGDPAGVDIGILTVHEP